MKKIVTALCALTLTVAATGAAFADCPGHASSKPPATSTQGT